MKSRVAILLLALALCANAGPMVSVDRPTALQDGTAPATYMTVKRNGRSYELAELKPTNTGNAATHAYMQKQVEKIGAYLEADKKYGLVSKIYWWNTNEMIKDQLTIAQHKAMIDDFCARYQKYLSNILMMAMNEDDTNTPKATIDSIRAHWRSKAVKGIILYERPGGQYIEWHPRSWGSYPGANNSATIFASDNGPPLDVLTIGHTFDGSGKPDIAKAQEMVRTAWGKKQSVDCYNFYGKLDENWVKACVGATK